MILAIDPGNTESAFVVVEDDLSAVIRKGKVPNQDLMELIETTFAHMPIKYVAIEMIASYGMAVGKDVFETCLWIGRFIDRIERILWKAAKLIYRKEEKMVLCQSMKAKDSNIRQALIDRFGPVGTKKQPGYFYGFKKDIWAAMAVACVFHDIYLER